MNIEEFIGWYRAGRRRTSSAPTTIAMLAADFAAVMLSFGTGFFLVNLYDSGAINFRSFVTYWPYLGVFCFLFVTQGLYPGVSLAPSEEMRHFAVASFLSHIVIVLSRYIEDREFGAISAALIISFAVSTLFLLFFRTLTRRLLTAAGLPGISAVVYGDGPLARRLVDKLICQSGAGYTPTVMLTENSRTEAAYRGVPILRGLDAGEALAARLGIRMAFIAAPGLDSGRLSRFTACFRHSVVIPDFGGLANVWMSVRDFNGLLGLASDHKITMPWNLAAKRALDLVITIPGMLVLLPLFLLIALLIKVTSRGPVFYTHERIGRYGKPFRFYKFRTMAVDADARLASVLASDSEMRREWEAIHKLKKDPRVTPLGAILRAASLDEFPQLLNVLKGDMSLVGPRPIVKAEIPKYGASFDSVFAVRPGISGLWQVSGRSDTGYQDRVAFDLYYLRSWSIWLDLWVLYKTAGAVLNKEGAY